MPTTTYPDTWPSADPARPEALHSRITEKEKEDLYQRRVTTRELAASLGVHEKWLSARFPGKAPIPNTKVLIQARREYKIEMGKRVLQGLHTINEAAKMVHVSWNTMYRYVKKAKTLNPELAANFPALVQQRREQNAKKT